MNYELGKWGSGEIGKLKSDNWSLITDNWLLISEHSRKFEVIWHSRRTKRFGILSSTSPLKLDALRYPTQRWFSRLRVTFRMPYDSPPGPPDVGGGQGGGQSLLELKR